VIFNDEDYDYNYKPNTKDAHRSLWTGTSYQVGLNYTTDVLTSNILKLFEPDQSKHPELEMFATRGM
jgi:hypothetical protein